MRALDQGDFDDLFGSADDIDRRPPARIEELRKEIARSNPMRWLSLQTDLRWLKRQMKKRGMNPEDARWLL